MKKLITLAVFDSALDIRYNLLKDMLEEAGIHYLTNNENLRMVKPLPWMTPSNLSIDIKVYQENLEEARRILETIK